MTRIEHAMEIEKQAKEKAEAEGEIYIPQSKEKIMHSECPGGFIDSAPTKHPAQGQKRCKVEIRRDSEFSELDIQKYCVPCWTEEYTEG